jgi:hypothetical protein
MTALPGRGKKVTVLRQAGSDPGFAQARWAGFARHGAIGGRLLDRTDYFRGQVVTGPVPVSDTRTCLARTRPVPGT